MSPQGGVAYWIAALGWFYGVFALLGGVVIVDGFLVTGKGPTDSGAFLLAVAISATAGWLCFHTASLVKKGAGGTLATGIAAVSLFFFPIGTVLAVAVIYNMTRKP
jgi:hypothetical protein